MLPLDHPDRIQIASPCIFPRAGPCKTSSVPPSPNYAPCHYPPDRADGV